jgi:hypothetical protein
MLRPQALSKVLFLAEDSLLDLNTVSPLADMVEDQATEGLAILDAWADEKRSKT